MSSKLRRIQKNSVRPAIGLALATFVITAYPSSGLAQAPIPPNSVQPSSARQPELPYTLGSGDRVRVDIYRVPQYSGEVDVLVDGSLNLALVGTVPVEGLTLEQASNTISAAYSRFLRRPIVTVTLLNRRAIELGVAGEVNRPGSYTIAPNDPQPPTVTRLLQAAGGTTLTADVRQVQIQRPQRSGGNQVINVDLWQLVQTGDLRYDVALRDGDTVFIPTNPSVNLDESPLLADATFSGVRGQSVNIAIVGEVNRPGTYTIGGTGTASTAGSQTIGLGNIPTVTRAIQTAGGIKPRANIREVEVQRRTRSGTPQTFKVNLWNLLQGDLRQDALLQEGDTIVIPTAAAIDPAEEGITGDATFSPNTIQVNVVGEVPRPGAIELRPASTLNQAILAAGGFNNRARRSTVQLIRLSDDGTVSRQTLEVDFAQGIAQNNPTLQNGDVVIVGRSGLASVSDTLGQVLAPLGNALSIFQLPFRFLDIFR